MNSLNKTFLPTKLQNRNWFVSIVKDKIGRLTIIVLY
jgi:hypothetical protein